MTEGFTCAVEKEEYRSVCKDLSEYQDTGYCVLHYPVEEKNKEDFLKVKKSKLAREDYDFGGTVFPEGTSDFQGFEFEANVSFAGAQFRGETTYFSNAQFSVEWTDFSHAQFSGETTYFSGAEFSGAAINFHEATFMKEVSFTGATFKQKVSFWGSKANLVFDSRAWAHFNGSRIEKPELLTFNTVLLHPGWFINTDVRKVDFTDVQWYGMPGGPKGTLDGEIAGLKKRNIESPHYLLAQACRRLSANAEENREYPLANEFHYWSMDALRKESWDYLIWIREWIRKSGLRVPRRWGLATTLRLVWRRIKIRRQSRPRSRFGLINTLYWALSGYGVRAARAFWVLLAMWAAFTILYVLVDPSEFKDFGQGIGYLWQAAVYSSDPTWDISPIEPFDRGDFTDTGDAKGTWSPWFGHGKVDAQEAVAEALRRKRGPSA